MLGSKDGWIDEFSKLGVKDWADEFGDQFAQGALGDGTSSEWVDSYDRYVLKPPYLYVGIFSGEACVWALSIWDVLQINHMPVLLKIRLESLVASSKNVHAAQHIDTSHGSIQ